MTIISIALATAVLIIIIYATRESLTKAKVLKSGGMLNKYHILISEIMKDDPKTQIFRHTSISVFLGLENIDGHTYIILLQKLNGLKVSWVVKSSTFGLHNLDWKFPDRQEQVEMISTIRRDVSNYSKKALFGISDFLGSGIFENISIEEKEFSLRLIATNFNCNVSEAKSMYFRIMEDLDGSEEDINSIYRILPARMTEEAKKYGINPKNTPSAIYWDWLKEYSKIKKFKTPAKDFSVISDLHDANPDLLLKLIEAKGKGDNKEFDKLLAKNPGYLDLFISKLADSDENSDEIGDELPF